MTEPAKIAYPVPPKDPTDAEALDPNAGFGRFTPRARNAVVVAQSKTQEAGNSEISPDHLLLAMFDDPDGLAVKLLAGQGVDGGRLHRLGVDRERFERDLATALQPFTKS